jgi:hypothetical protein
MRFDSEMRAAVRRQLEELAGAIRAWDADLRLPDDERRRLLTHIGGFPHMAAPGDWRLAGVAGNGGLPLVAYGESLVYFTAATSAVYAADRVTGLRELDPAAAPLVNLTWVPDDPPARAAALDHAFALLAGRSLQAVVEASDYRRLKAAESGRQVGLDTLLSNLIPSHAGDTGSISLQLAATAEYGAALQLLAARPDLTHLLLEGTLSLPLVARPEASLFYEHLKRLCCVEARSRSLVFLTISKTPGLPGLELIEDLAREAAGLAAGQVAEHWYLRIPTVADDAWELSLAADRRLPPPGAVTYLIRFHRTTPVLRIDLDRVYWREWICTASPAATRDREAVLFAALDYAGHDQRTYGYPYPLRAAQARVALAPAERVALRKQIVEGAVRAGMKRTRFRDFAPLAKEE